MMWLRKYRILLLVYGVGAVFGVHEFMFKQGRPPFEWLTPEGAVLSDMLAQLNPDDPDTHYLKAMNALADGNEAEFKRRLDLVLASDMKHNELMLRFHAEYLLAAGADTAAINAALTRWRRNFPYEARPINFRLAMGPSTVRQAEALERLAADIPWVSDVRLGRITDRGVEQWILAVMIRRGRTIEVRDVSAAVRQALTY